jgi:hypothetical protein
MYLSLTFSTATASSPSARGRLATCACVGSVAERLLGGCLPAARGSACVGRKTLLLRGRLPSGSSLQVLLRCTSQERRSQTYRPPRAAGELLLSSALRGGAIFCCATFSLLALLRDSLYSEQQARYRRCHARRELVQGARRGHTGRQHPRPRRAATARRRAARATDEASPRRRKSRPHARQPKEVRPLGRWRDGSG